MLNIGVLISGGGTNLQAIIDETKSGGINGTVKLVISNKENAYGLERARLSGIKAVYETNEDKIIGLLKENNIDLIVLAGYLKIITPKATVHFGDEGADTGAIIMQETVNVEQDDDAKTLAKRVLEVEHRILKESIRLFCENKLSIQGRRVFINE